MRLNFGYLYKFIKLHIFFFLFFIKKQKITDVKVVCRVGVAGLNK